MLSSSKEEVPQEGTEVERSSPPPGSPGKMVQDGIKPRLWLWKITLPLAMDLNNGSYHIPSFPFNVMLRQTWTAKKKEKPFFLPFLSELHWSQW